MSRSRIHLTVLAALATSMAVLPLTTLVAQMSFVSRFFWLLMAVAATGIALRRLGAQPVVTAIGQVLVVALLTVWTVAGDTTWYAVPTLDSARRIGELFWQFGATVYAAAAPIPSNPGVDLTLALIGAGIAILVDHIAIGRRAPAAAGLVLLTAYLTAAANSSTALAPGYFVAAAGSWLILLARHAQLQMRRWATTGASQLTPSATTGDSEGPFGVIARRLGVTVLLGALALPLVMPHLPARYLLDGLARSADGRPGPVTRVGYSSTLDVGRSLTSGRSDVVLRYRTNAATPAPLRVFATGDYDGTSWNKPTATLGQNTRLDVADMVGRAERVVTVLDNTLEPPALAAPQPLIGADLGGVSWRIDQATSDLHVQARPRDYTITYLELTITPELLRDGVDGRPGPDRLPVGRAWNSQLFVDQASTPAVRDALTQAVPTSSRTSPYDTAMAIQEWLRSGGGFTYTLELPDSAGADGITAFLRTKQGYCVQFASAMVMMARSAGIPARMAVGFLPGSLSDGLYAVSSADAHTWPELFFPGAGWVRFEPTPSARTGTPPPWTVVPRTADPAPTVTPPSGQEAAERPDRERDGAQADGGPLTEIDQPWRDRIQAWLADPWHAALAGLLLLALAALVLPTTAVVLRALRRRRAATPEERIEAAWRELTSRLGDLGIPPPEGATLRETSSHYARAGYLSPEPREALGGVVATLERVRYARPDPGLDPEPAASQARAVITAASRSRGWRQRVRAVLLPSDAAEWWRRIGRRALPGGLPRFNRRS